MRAQTKRGEVSASGPATIEDIKAWPAAVGLKAAARAVNIGTTKAYELVREEKFPIRVRRVGGVYRVSTADLLQYLGVRDHPAGESAAWGLR